MTKCQSPSLETEKARKKNEKRRKSPSQATNLNETKEIFISDWSLSLSLSDLFMAYPSSGWFAYYENLFFNDVSAGRSVPGEEERTWSFASKRPKLIIGLSFVHYKIRNSGDLNRVGGRRESRISPWLVDVSTWAFIILVQCSLKGVHCRNSSTPNTHHHKQSMRLTRGPFEMILIMEDAKTLWFILFNRQEQIQSTSLCSNSFHQINPSESPQLAELTLSSLLMIPCKSKDGERDNKLSLPNREIQIKKKVSPSLFMPMFRHFLRRQAWHWFLWALSTMHVPVPAWHLHS